MVADHLYDLIANSKQAIEVVLADDLEVVFDLLLCEFRCPCFNFYKKSPYPLPTLHPNQPIDSELPVISKFERNLAVSRNSTCRCSQRC